MSLVKKRGPTYVESSAIGEMANVTKADSKLTEEAARLYPRSLGDACSHDANCSSSALCIADRCTCPPGFEPWGERNCSAIYDVAPAASWLSPLLGLSGLALIAVLVLCICAFVHRGLQPCSTEGYLGRKQSATLIVWSQASVGDQLCSTPAVLLQPSQATESTSGQQMDTELFGAVMHLDSLIAASERSTELTNQMSTITELRGLCSAAEDSFVRPVLSGEELYSKYPHLREVLSPSEASSEPPPPSTPARSIQRSEGSFMTEVFGTSSTPWSSFGNSMDSLLGIPVIARFYTSTSDTDTPVRTSSGKSSDGPSTSPKASRQLNTGR